MVRRICKNLAILILVTSAVSGSDIIRRITEPLEDSAGNSQGFTIFGEAISGERLPEISLNFVYSIDPYDVTTVVSGTGSQTQTSSMAKLSTGASASSSSTLISKGYLLYHSGYQAEAGMTAIFPAACIAGSIALAGIGDSEGAVQIGCVDDEFVIRHVDGHGATTDVEQSLWNRDRAIDGDNENNFALDQSKLNIYRISYAWFGTGPIVVSVFMGAKKGWRPLHVFDEPNTRTTPHMVNPSLPMTAYVSNTTNTTNIDLYTASWAAWHVGPLQDAGHRVYATSSDKAISAGVESHVASIRVTTTFKTRHNHIPIVAQVVKAAVDGNKPVTLKIYKNCSSLSGGGWTSINADSSITEVNTGISSFTCAGGALVDTLQLGKAESGAASLPGQGLHTYPGDAITVTASSGQSSDVSASIQWIELF
jgi:hypothetical protein